MVNPFKLFPEPQAVRLSRDLPCASRHLRGGAGFQRRTAREDRSDHDQRVALTSDVGLVETAQPYMLASSEIQKPDRPAR